MLNDGASGLADLKRCGGVTVVQSPSDATEAEMPRAALLASDIDYRAPAAGLAGLIMQLADQASGPAPMTPVGVALEVAISMGRPSDSPTIADIAAPVPLTCPGCGGALSQIERSPLRFRCQVGHGYTAEALAHEQENSVDEAFRIALRVIGERTVLLEKMARRAPGRQNSGRRKFRGAGPQTPATVLMEAALKA